MYLAVNKRLDQLTVQSEKVALENTLKMVK